jgi:hypothetical protein
MNALVSLPCKAVKRFFKFVKIREIRVSFFVFASGGGAKNDRRGEPAAGMRGN